MSDLQFDEIRSLMPARPDDAHKGTMGTLTMLCGSYGYAGAGILSARAALRSGVGLLYQVIPESIYPIFASAVPQAVCLPLSDSVDGTLSHRYSDYILNRLNASTAGVIGCGLKNTEDIEALIQTILIDCRVPLVVDADGINALALHIDILSNATPPIILTPHPKEFARISGMKLQYVIDHHQKAAEQFSRRYPGVVLVLKGHRTVIAQNGVLRINPTGNSGMAKGGSGDVLSGIIGSLLAQGLSPIDAACAGVYIHGAAGDIAAERLSKTAMLPSDIIDALPDVFRSLEQ